MQPTPQQQVNQLTRDVDQRIKSLPSPRPMFALDVGWATSYEELLRNDVAVTDERDTLAKIARHGRGILVGRGGGGKTHLLYRVARAARRNGILPIFIDLKNWTGPDYEEWDKWMKRLDSGSGFLIERFSSPKTTYLELDWLPPTTPKLLLVDGLNEISSSVGQEILVALDEFVSHQIQASVLVVDRLTRRELPTPARWALGRVMPLSQQKIVQYGGEKFLNKPFSTMLDLPFFLNAMLQHKGAAPGDFHTHQEFLAAHSGLTPPQLALASQAAFHVYQTRMARTFPIQEFADVASPDVTNRLLSSGILSTSNDTAQFYHHLLHDILASRHFGNLPEEQWNSENLDAISFRASSFDGVSFVFEQLEGERADSFLRHVYDWNPYAAGYALGELDPELSGASMEMETVIFAMLAEKRFDPLLATRRRAADGLLITKSPHAQAYRDATNLQDVFEAVAAVDSNTAWFVAWRGVFTRDAGGTAQDQEINSLHDEDSVIGWTWANVLKRLVLTDAQQQILRQMLDAENQITILWRAAHVLGAFPSLANVVSLDALLSPNQARYVRYGAIRSLAEIAYRSPTEEIRNAVVDAIKERSSDLMMDEFVMGELKRALQITPGLQPESWITIVTQIAREFYLLSEEPMRRDSWRKYLADTESIYKNVPLQA